MKKNILIVDDSPTLRASVNFVLSGGGYEVFQADNGEAGLKKLEEIKKSGKRINLIISDINMPKMNGLEFLRAVKDRSSLFKFIPVIILTTEREDTLKRQGKEYGAAGWMTKPFQPDLLLSVVKKFIR
ncbi:MAG: response regulator [bacterium]|nr:response regulator [bacterium]